MEVSKFLNGFGIFKQDPTLPNMSLYYRKGEWIKNILNAEVFETRQEAVDMIKSLSTNAPLENEIRAKCNELAEFLIEKNKAYGNSASEPAAIFAKRLDKLAQIDVRIDDKLSRLMKGSEYPGDDTIKDLTGYLILRMIVAEVDEVRT